jgi:hypothetical protein
MLILSKNEQAVFNRINRILQDYVGYFLARRWAVFRFGR